MGAAPFLPSFLLFPSSPSPPPPPSLVWICHFIYLTYLFMEWSVSRGRRRGGAAGRPRLAPRGSLRWDVGPRAPRAPHPTAPEGFGTGRGSSGPSLLRSPDPTELPLKSVLRLVATSARFWRRPGGRPSPWALWRPRGAHRWRRRCLADFCTWLNLHAASSIHHEGLGDAQRASGGGCPGPAWPSDTRLAPGPDRARVWLQSKDRRWGAPSPSTQGAT